MHFISASTRRYILLALLGLAAALVACGGSGGEAAAVPPTPTLEPLAAAGQPVFVQHCGACHSTQPDTIIVGPSLHGIAERGGARVDGQDARTYIYTSILRPNAYLVEGFQDLMPSDLGKTLTGEQLDGVVAYLLALQ